jgi:hypothetical protein
LRSMRSQDQQVNNFVNNLYRCRGRAFPQEFMPLNKTIKWEC